MTQPDPIPRAQAEKHSRLPWSIEQPEGIIIFARGGGNVARVLRGGFSGNEQRANSALIVEAVNGRAALQAQNARLREALIAAEMKLDMLATFQTFGTPHHIVIEAMKDTANDALIAVRQALAAPQEDTKP